MKKMVIVLIFVLFLVAGCVPQYSENDMANAQETEHTQQPAELEQEQEIEDFVSETTNALRFPSLEHFLLALQATRQGEDISGFVQDMWQGSGASSLEDVVEQLGLATISELLLPTGVPAGYVAFRVDVAELYVAIDYLPQEILAEMHPDDAGMFWQDVFSFSFSRDADGVRIQGDWVDSGYKSIDLTSGTEIATLLEEVSGARPDSLTEGYQPVFLTGDVPSDAIIEVWLDGELLYSIPTIQLDMSNFARVPIIDGAEIRVGLGEYSLSSDRNVEIVEVDRYKQGDELVIVLG